MKRFDMDRFSMSIVIKRDMCNLSLRELSELTKISAPTISRIEQGVGAPDMATFAALCDWLNIDPIRFFTEEKTK